MATDRLRLPGRAVQTDCMMSAAVGLMPGLHVGGCTEDEVGLVDRILLEECHRCGALAELRESFNQAWLKMWNHGVPPEAFDAWFFSVLNAEESAWPPVPGCELRGKTTAAELEIPAVKNIADWARAQFPRDFQKLTANNAAAWTLLEAAARTFAEAAMELATDIRVEWFWRYQLSIKDPRADPLRVEMDFNAAEGGAPASVHLTLVGELPRYVQACKLKLTYKLHGPYAAKLHSRFEEHNVKFSGAGPFAARCWQLMARYQTVFGRDGICAGWHSAVTDSAMSSLVEEFGVSHELFASPLNCALPGYCSLFEDIDKFFGSSGSFFKFTRSDGPLMAHGGSYECNPPFDDELLKVVVPALLQTLTMCTLPLSIALILPCWKWSTAVAAAAASPFYRGRVDVNGRDNAYMYGLQHCCKNKERIWYSSKHKGLRTTGSVILLLQNDAWATRWPVTAINLARHRAAWCQT